MKWYEGNIAEAVSHSKEKNAIFVVFVEGKDEFSQKLKQFIDNDKIRPKLESDDFVAIKIDSDSQSYMQFATIYQMVPVPSIFFIGKSGTPLEITTGLVGSVDELEQKIDKVLTMSLKNPSSTTIASSAFIASEQTAAVKTAVPAPGEPSTSSTANNLAQEPSDEFICDGDVCYKKPKPAVIEKETVVAEEEKEKKAPQNSEQKKEVVENSEQSAASEIDAQAQLAETRKTVEERRRQRIELEKELERRRELKRRQESKDVQHVQQWQKEQELKELKENMRRERLEEQAARERIRAQIAADRAERATKFASEAEGTTSSAAVTAGGNVNANIPNPTSASTSPRDNGGEELARLQFRLSTGNTRTHSFNNHETLGIVRTYVKKELLPGTGIREFILATTYPKREFSTENDRETLVELGLYPTAVILVIGKTSSNPVGIITRSGGIFNILSSLFWTVLSPVFSVLGYIKSIASGRGGTARNDDGNAGNVGAQKRANEEQGAQHDAAKRRNLDRFLSGPSTSKDSSNNPNRFNDNNDQKPYQRYGSSNIHRLSDNRKDSDDENATWNGNSTQQQ